MRTMTVRNIPDELYERIKKSAASHRRSINGEVVSFLERMFPRLEDIGEYISEEELLKRIREHREEMARKGVFVTEEFLNKAKNWGRL